MKLKLIIYLTTLSIVSSAQFCDAQILFKHDVKSKATPWTYEPKGRTADQFAFAIIGDLNSGERSGVLEVAAEQINLLKPDLVLSIGDLIEGCTEDTVVLKKQFDLFDQRVSK